MTTDKKSCVYNTLQAYAVCTDEEWRQISGWPYEVSNRGRVRRVYSHGYYGLPLQGGTCGPHRNKYPAVTLSEHQQRKTIQRHLLVARAFLGPCPDGLEVDHIDGDKFNCRLDNLRYVPPAENIRQSVERGHWGSNRWNAKLNPGKVRLIRFLHHEGLLVKEIMKEIGTSESAVYHVLRGDSWKHVT